MNDSDQPTEQDSAEEQVPDQAPPAGPEDAAEAVPETAPETPSEAADDAAPPAKKATAKKAAAPRAKKTAAKKTTAKKSAAKKAGAKKSAKKVAESPTDGATDGADDATSETAATEDGAEQTTATAVLFQAPETIVQPSRRRRSTTKKVAAAAAPAEDDEEQDAQQEVPAAEPDEADETDETKQADQPDGQSDGQSEGDDGDDGDDGDGDGSGAKRRGRRRGGRRRRKAADDTDGAESDDETEQDGDTADGEGQADQADQDDAGDGGGSSSSRRRRRRRRSGGGNGDGESHDDGQNGNQNGGGQNGGNQNGGGQNGGRGGRGGKGRSRSNEDGITALSGSTRLEAKRQRRREGREAGRRRAPVVSEAEFLARRESVERHMVVRQREDLTQIGVLEDNVLVEHYVARESQTSLIGNVYLGRVQNVLPSMEAAFVDIGKGRNAVLYAGEVNWTALGAKDGQPRKIESVLSSGQTILVQVSKDPIGHKGARLTSQVSLPGRFLVYVPDGTTSGISRKLPENERHRLKKLLKEIVPDTAGVIVRTAAEGASEEELTHDVERLTARWDDIEAKQKSGGAPQLLYGEPDLTLKVVRDLFTEDFASLAIQGDDAWDVVDSYVAHVAPDLRERLQRWIPSEHDGADLFTSYRIDEQIAKALDRKVWLPSGGSLIIDRTEAMTVVDVNTGKFTGSGGNLEETVTKNNLEAAEEMVRQLRLRDIGGIVVIDFIDMVLESNRELVLRRLVECLGRDRTRHQVAEVTSLGLVQMTRKRIGTGLLEAFSTDCDACKGRGLTLHDHPVEPGNHADDAGGAGRGGRRGRGGRGRNGGAANGNGGNGNGAGNGGQGSGGNGGNGHHAPTPAEFAAMAGAAHSHDDDVPADETEETLESAAELAPDAAPEEGADAATLDQAETSVVEGPEDSPVEPVETVEPVEAAPEPVEEPAAPAPVVVTTTRRRSARRVAGPPAAEPSHSSQPSQPAPTSQTDEPDREQVASVEADAEDATEAVSGEGESDEAVFHVPVKRKGSRRR